jgi:outer membrane protein assembly factor BamA
MRTMISCLNLLRLPRRVGRHLGLWWVLSTALIGLPHAFADKSYVPLPIFTTDPNERQTYGALLAIIDEREGVFHSILVPYGTINPLLGVAASVHYEQFFAHDTKFDTDFSQSTENQALYRLRYFNPELADQRYYLQGQLSYDNDRTARFFGLGAASRKEDQSNYTLSEFLGRFTFGQWLQPDLLASLTERFRNVNIRPGAVTSLPFLQNAFTDVPGENGAFVWAHRLALTYDSRNAIATPTSGRFGQVFVEVATSALGSEASFVRYGLEGRWLWPHFEERLVTVVRGLIDRVDGPHIPFFELASLGGDDSLRGFGDNRFLDEGRFLVNAEERIKVFHITYGNVRTDIELAVFAEAGRVFHNFSDLGSGKVQAVWGGGIRFVAASQIVAKIDVGIGSEGAAVFTGLNYPF